MTYDEAQAAYKSIVASSLTDLRDDLLGLAVSYARIRTDWRRSDNAQRQEMDRHRSLTHNAFIDSCNILSRNQLKIGEDNSWRSELGSDRRVLGDFACLIHCFLGLEA